MSVTQEEAARRKRLAAKAITQSSNGMLSPSTPTPATDRATKVQGGANTLVSAHDYSIVLNVKMLRYPYLNISTSEYKPPPYLHDAMSIDAVSSV